MLSAFLLGILAAGPAGAQTAPAEPPPQPVKGAEVFQKRLEVERAFVGSVVPTRVSQVSSTVESRVVAMFVEAGDRVKKGDKPAQLRTEAIQIDLEAAQAERDLLDYELQQLTVSRPMELEQAKARMAAAEALKDFTKARRARLEALVAKQVISEDELDEILSTATGAMKVFEERTIGWELSEATLPIEINQAKAKLKAQDEKIARLKDDIAEHTILAPFDGYVTEEYTEVGQWLAKGAAVVEVVEANDRNEIEIQVPVLETYISQLKVRSADGRPGTQAMRVEIEALSGEEFQGDVVAIVPKADLNARSFPVKLRLTNRSGPNGTMLKPGMLARVTLPVTEIADAVLVPKDALVLEEGKETSIWMVRKGEGFEETHVGHAVPVRVSLGESDGDWIEVRAQDGNPQDLLRPGELVIFEGNERVNPALPVRVVETIRHGAP